MTFMKDRKSTMAEDALKARFEDVVADLPGADVPWVREMRESACERFNARGLPDRRVEAWKYSDLRAKLREASDLTIEGDDLTEAEIYEALGVDFDEMLSYRITIVDGAYRPELSNLEGAGEKLEVLSMRDALNNPPTWLQENLGQVNPREDEAVIDLNTAFMSDGVALRVAPGAQIERPIHLIMITGSKTSGFVNLRNFVEVGEGAKLTLLETYATRRAPDMQRNSVTEMKVGDKAQVEHIKYQNEGRRATHVTSWMVALGEKSKYSAFEFAIGGDFARHQTFLRFLGEHAYASISGAMMLWDTQHADATVVVNHDVPNCTGRELFKCVLDDRAHGVVQGKAIVHKRAQKTDGHQMARSLMLSEIAQFSSKPELEIYADDVICGHGSTSGELDENLLFYLRARGIPEDKARALLVNAFIDEAIERVENDEIRMAFLTRSADWLGQKREEDN